MQNNFHFFRVLTPALEGKIAGAVVSECFTQEKDQLIIRLETVNGPFFIRTSLSPSFSCISFPKEFHRARKNSADLFEAMIGQRVRSVRQYQFERSFSLLFEDGMNFLFKMHGNRSNLILYRDEIAVDLFKKNLEADWQLVADTLDRVVDWSQENFRLQHDHLKSLFFTFGKVVWRYLEDLEFFDKNVDQQWHQVSALLNYLNHPTFYVTNVGGTVTFSLVNVGAVMREFPDPFEALNFFYQTYAQHDVFQREKSVLMGTARKRLVASRQFHDNALERIHSLEVDNNYKTWADLVMANLHSIVPGQERIVLPDFYHDNQSIEIKLKPTLTPQKNAAIYYQKSKKQQIELNRLKGLIAEKEHEMNADTAILRTLEEINDLKTLRNFSFPQTQKKKDKTKEPSPYHEFEHQGFKILVGRNAESNDKLLQRFSYKDDLWLHAKDVAGSHVLIKYVAGKNFPKDVIERAAQLAGYYSKRKTDTLCPVVVTPRKFVRKRKGDPAGAVVVERETVIMVEPKA